MRSLAFLAGAAAICLLFMVNEVGAEPRIVYVDCGATGANSGASWADAYLCLQDCLSAARILSGPVTIRVAQGTYTPDRYARKTRSGPEIVATLDRAATFQLVSLVTLEGGYAGSGSDDPKQRDVGQYPTVLSGDLAGDDATVDDPADLPAELTRAENSYHVVTARGVGQSTVLDGFTICAGCAVEENGAGLTNEAGSPTIVDCTFLGNSCDGVMMAADGGALYNGSGSRPTIVNCTFSHNAADGGAVYNAAGSSPTFTACTFDRNYAHIGGAMYNRGCDLVVASCRFAGNVARTAGALFNVDFAALTVSNSVLCGNRGGAMTNLDSALVTMTNCTITDNWNDHCGGVYTSFSSQAALKNCIVWGNNAESCPELAVYRGARLELAYCDVRAPSQVRDELGTLVWREGNLDVDPLFASPGRWVDRHEPGRELTPADANAIWTDGDYHLRSWAGRWDPASQRWKSDNVTSGCIDMGDPTEAPDEEPAPNGNRVNLGAYGATSEASLSTEIAPGPALHAAYICAGDASAGDGLDVFLRPRGCAVTVIPLADVALTPLADYQVIITGPEVGKDNSPASLDAYAAMDNSGNPIIGMGEGGHAFFGRFDLAIGPATDTWAPRAAFAPSIRRQRRLANPHRSLCLPAV
ncbi:MAG: right-handed parallel beta-helix repeat-containing protein [Sedimentisphaerales bacterium]|nr:right-handed parallel beta-helix repeat-containing protein [Sedimentisphaerales bacterium]